MSALPRFCPAILILFAAALTCVESDVRHIVFIVADDLGWNDVGFHNQDMITPNIDKLANEGVKLNSSYVQPVCTPSRHSFMTGIYPFKAGLQRHVIKPNMAECSPLNLEFFPQKLQKLGYATHIIGKWHLGYCNWNCTPTYRGFDSFLGYYNGKEDYYNKTFLNGKDFRDGVEPVMDTEYSTFIYANRAVDIIQTHDKNKSLFLYLPFQSVHAPIQVPKKYEDMYPNIQNEGRRQYCGMVTAMDEAIGNVTNALEQNGLMDDTLIVFTPDNGGMPIAHGNNYPLRGGKTTIFEGGTRAAAFVHGAGLEKTGYTYDGLMHAVDWHPTIIAAAGGETNADIDGVNQWNAIRKGGESNRLEFVYNLDNMTFAPQGHAAIREGDFKLIDGYPGPFQDWYKPEEVHVDDRDENEIEDETLYYERISHDFFTKSKGRLFEQGLYNIRDDPTEHHDLSSQYPETVKRLKAKLDEYRKSIVEPKNDPVDPASNPANYNGYWSPGWC